ncbi:MAG: VCBS repeat-containing protein [candidate division WOR-3 bacterium]|nr:MAG: VCBS repeat-containing protein [candidate division WOR-3 bacterium]
MRLLTFALALAGILCPLHALTWVETEAVDFQDGGFTRNLYSSHRDGGAVEFVPRLDLNNDGYIDLACPDDSGPYLRVYFGSATGYDSARSRYYPIPAGGGGVDFADLDHDGNADMIHSGWRAEYVTVYWGDALGPSPDDTTRLWLSGWSETVVVCDLDRDSYLDILAGSSNDRLYIFWGSDSGYTSTRVTPVSLGGNIGHNLELADYDQDGLLDAAAIPWNRNTALVMYWDSLRVPREFVYLPVSGSNPHGITTADLDHDGWLDLVFTGYDTATTAYIYYGSEDGFSEANLELIHPDLCYGGSAAAFWDDDTSLDLVFFRGDFNPDTLLIPGVFFNDPAAAPHFSDLRRADIGNESLNASGGMIADLDRDGHTDVYIDGYNDGDPSLVLYGPDWTRNDRLPVDRSHHGLAREFGNAYNRAYREEYLSSVFDGTLPQIWHVVSWDDTTPGNTLVELAVRTGDSLEPGIEWSDWLAVGNGDSLPDTLASRFIQYRVWMSYETPAILPILSEVRIDYEPLPYHDVGPTAVLAPSGLVDSGSVIVPQVEVSNFGNQEAVFPVTLRIGGDYDETVQDSLAAGATDTVAFPDWTALPMDTLPVLCFTALIEDEDRSNDTIAGSVIVAPPPHLDVGAVEILAPLDSVDSADVIVPRALVRNYGNVATGFPVTLEVGDYSMTVFDTLDAGTSDTVSFPAWTASPVGSLQVICYTWLAGDERPGNDTARALVFVKEPPHPDVGATVILRPTGVIDSGYAITPVAVVENFGNVDARFPVVMTVGTSFSDTTESVLTPGQTDTVEFAEWTASVPGTHPVLCYTLLDDDEDRSNDTARTTAIVVVPGHYDVGVVEVIAPLGQVDSGESRVPRAVVHNYGNLQTSFPVTMTIGVDYAETVTHQLTPGATDSIDFPNWTATPVGLTPVICFTRLLPDDNRTNDTAYAEVDVLPAPFHDIGTSAILAPVSSMVAGDTVSPRATVHNYGDRTEDRFRVLFRIGTDYSRVLSLDTLLDPDSSLEVAFPVWTARPGTHVVSCSTLLSTDLAPENDRKQLTLGVARPYVLRIEEDISASLSVDEDSTFGFYAILTGDSGAVVDLKPPESLPGWYLELEDDQGIPLGATLGWLDTNETRRFRLHVKTPSEDLAGVRDSMTSLTLFITGYLRLRSEVRDSAALSLVLTPPLQIHNYPNPFAGHTNFVIGIPYSGNANLTVYDRSGERIRRILEQEPVEPGIHIIRWDASGDRGVDVAPGSYRYVFEFNSGDAAHRILKKLVIIQE